MVNQRQKMWLFHYGDNQLVWDDMVNDNYLSVFRWGEIGKIDDYDTKETITQKLKTKVKTYNEGSKAPGHSVNMLYRMKFEMKLGDYVFCLNKDLKTIEAWGTVTSGYDFVQDHYANNHRIGVKWTVGDIDISGIVKQSVDKPSVSPGLQDVTKKDWAKKALELIQGHTITYINHKKNATIMVPNIIKDIEKLLKNSGQVILQGAPGCGKTYITTELAVYLCDGAIPEGTAAQKKRYKELQAEGRIGFTTFHQSLDYEEFVEGLKPETDDKTGEMHFEVKPGIFRCMCSNALAVKETNFDEAYSRFIADICEKDDITILTTINGNQFGVTANSNNNLSLYTGHELNKNGVLTKENLNSTANGTYSGAWPSYYRGVINYLSEKYGYTESVSTERKNYVLIIDEINRANISKVLGELITLLEKSKRLGNDDEFTVTLPYSGDTFGVPDNLYIIGTMNTADRSLGYIDYAIRRRFAFMTLEADPFIIKEHYNFRGDLMEKEIKLFNDIKTIITRHISDDFDIKDIMVGHSYFLSKDDEDFRINLDYKIRPLLEEYLRDGILVENGTVKDAIERLGKDNVQ